MSEFISRILDNDFLGNNFIQVLIPILIIVALLSYFGYITYDFLDVSDTEKTQGVDQMEQVDPLDWGFANPKPNSRDLMDTRGGRKHWQDQNFGSAGMYSVADVQASEAHLDRNIGDAVPLGDMGVGVVYGANGDQLSYN